MSKSSELHKILLFSAATLSLMATVPAQDISLLATVKGITISTSLNIGDGRLEMGVPGIINEDIWKPIEPTVEMIDDNNLALHYPNGAEIKVSIAGTKVTFSCSKIPAEATRISTGFTINRDAWQGSRFSFNETPLEPFPEEDSRKNLFEGKAKLFTLVDPAGTGMAIAGPDLHFTLANKGPEGWSHFVCTLSYMFADHPGETEFSLEFRTVTGK